MAPLALRVGVLFAELTQDYLPKPFNARELIARAHMQLQLGKKRRMMEQQFDERTNELRVLTESRSIAG